jgi:hypothetical protein
MGAELSVFAMSKVTSFAFKAFSSIPEDSQLQWSKINNGVSKCALKYDTHTIELVKSESYSSTFILFIPLTIIRYSRLHQSLYRLYNPHSRFHSLHYYHRSHPGIDNHCRCRYYHQGRCACRHRCRHHYHCRSRKQTIFPH